MSASSRKMIGSHLKPDFIPGGIRKNVRGRKIPGLYSREIREQILSASDRILFRAVKLKP